jgi:hypothetical protein
MANAMLLRLLEYNCFFQSAFMQPRPLQHVSVWLEDNPSDERVFPQALDWAFRLSLPLRAVVTSSRFHTHSTNQNSPVFSPKETNRCPGPVVEKMKAWGIACTQRGVALELFMWIGDGDAGMNQFLRPYGLCVFAEASSATQQDLLGRSARSRENAVLLCSPNCTPMTRILVVYDHVAPNAAYLESVARLCQALEVYPVILIVAKTEREANLGRGYAEGICNFFRLQADFDFVFGCDLRSAVKRVALWRSCSHVIIERQNAVSWWQRRNGDLLDQLRRLSESLTILALPEAVAFDVPHKIRGCSLKMLRNGSTDAQTISQ